MGRGRGGGANFVKASATDGSSVRFRFSAEALGLPSPAAISRASVRSALESPVSIIRHAAAVFPAATTPAGCFFFFFSRGKKKEKKKQCVRTQPAHAASGFPTARGILLMTGELINDRAAVSRLRSLVFPSCLIAARSSSVALAVRYALLRPACTGQFGTYTVSLPAIKSVGTPLLLLMRMPREAGTPPAASSHKSAGMRIIYGGMAHSRDTINVND